MNYTRRLKFYNSINSKNVKNVKLFQTYFQECAYILILSLFILYNN